MKKNPPLWGMRGGEVWMLNEPTGTRKRPRRARTNPALALYGNPAEGEDMARKRDGRGRFLKRHRKAGKRRRRVVRYAGANPPAHRRRRSTRRASSRRHARRNPGRFGGMRRLMPGPKRIVAGVAGAVASRMIPGYTSQWLPQIPSDGVGGLVVRAAAAIGAGWLAGKFLGAQIGEDMAFGGLVTVADDAGRMYLYPQLGLSAYLDPNLHAYLQPGIGQYMGPGNMLPTAGDLVELEDLTSVTDYEATRLDPSNRFAREM